MAESQETLSFDISSRLQELKLREKEHFKNIKDLDGPREYVADKLYKMYQLKNYEEIFDNYNGVVLKDEIDSIKKVEELERSYFSKRRYLLPLSIISVLGFMGTTKQCFSIKTFYENVNNISLVFGGSYLLGFLALDLVHRNNMRNYSNHYKNIIAKGRIHSFCVGLTNELKFDPDRHLE